MALRRQFDPKIRKVRVDLLVEVGLGLAMANEIDSDGAFGHRVPFCRAFGANIKDQSQFTLQVEPRK
jgi:hypothetical protein